MAIKTKRFIAARKSCSCSMPGVWRAVAYSKGCVVIFHSPRACAHVARSMDISAHYRALSDGRGESCEAVPLLCSQLEEKHSIFGGVERLEQCIEFVMREYKPECLVLANSCVAGVIGDDVESVAREAEEKYRVPVLYVDCCGFLDGEYYEGYYAITRQLIERFLQPAEKLPGTVLLLGDNGGPWGHYATEAARLLQSMGIRIVGQFPGYMAFRDLPKAAAAEAVILLGGRGQTHKGLSVIARQLQEKLGLPYLDIYPVGWSQTLKWILAVGHLLHCEEKAQSLIDEEVLLMQAQLERLVTRTKGRRAVLCIGRQLEYYHPAAVLETMELLQLDAQGIILLDALSEQDKEAMCGVIRALTDIPILNAQDGEQALLKSDVVLTTHELQNKDLKQIFLPMLPKVGTTGEIEFMQCIARVLQSRIKGGVTYV